MMKGKGAQFNPQNPFSSLKVGVIHDEGVDEYTHEEKPPLKIYYETPKTILSKNSSSDIPFTYSVNPYQGCEHGCIYCYARNSHTYWGFSSGLDFESKIVVKRDAVTKFERELSKPSWKPQPIMFSGNTDCYQPIEKDYKLTRGLISVALKYRNPISIITKNALIERDIDLLSELAKLNLVYVYFSITTLDERLRRTLEPRTSSAHKKLEAMRKLNAAGVKCGVMNAPIIPGLNHHEIPEILKLSSEAGAISASYTVVRLNGQLGELFEDWLGRFYPDRAAKVLAQIEELHGGNINDSQWGRRMSGEGNYAKIIDQLFKKSRKQYFGDIRMPPLTTKLFRKGGNYTLFSD